MSSTPKAPKMNSVRKRELDRADAYSRGYHQGQRDLMLNVKPEERKLNEAATALLISTGDNAREFGDKHLAFIIETVVEWVGDPDLIIKIAKESNDDDGKRKRDIADLA